MAQAAELALDQRLASKYALIGRNYQYDPLQPTFQTKALQARHHPCHRKPITSTGSANIDRLCQCSAN